MTEAHLSFDEIRVAAHDLALKRRQTIAGYEIHAKDAAEKERVYRKAKSVALSKRRLTGMAQDEAIAHANADVADERYARDVALSVAKADLQLIDALEREQSTLRQLADFSKDLETVG